MPCLTDCFPTHWCRVQYTRARAFLHRRQARTAVTPVPTPFPTSPDWSINLSPKSIDDGIELATRERLVRKPANGDLRQLYREMVAQDVAWTAEEIGLGIGRTDSVAPAGRGGGGRIDTDADTDTDTDYTM